MVPDEDHLYRALWFLEMGQVKAAGVHVRAAFEIILKSACYDFGLPVKFHADPRKVPASDLWAAVKPAEYDVLPPMQYAVNGKGKVVSWQPKKKRERVVPPALVQRIEHAVTWILNPLSHSQAVDRYRVEIEDAIYVIDDLDTTVKQALQLRSVHPVLVMQQIVGLLKARIAGCRRRSETQPPAVLEKHWGILGGPGVQGRGNSSKDEEFLSTGHSSGARRQTACSVGDTLKRKNLNGLPTLDDFRTHAAAV